MVQNTIQAVAQFGLSNRKLISVFVPQHARYFEELFIFFQTLMLDMFSSSSAQSRPYVEPVFNAYLKKALQHDNQVLRNYDTLLSPLGKSHSGVQYRPSQAVDKKNNKVLASTMPLDASFLPEKLQTSLPFGFFMYNKDTKNTFFIGKLGQFSYANPQENFWLTPVDKSIREQFLKFVSRLSKML